MPKASKKHLKPAITPEGREKQLISLAMDRAQEQLENGTASSQIITHFLKLGSIEAEVELEKRRKETALLEAKAKQVEASERIETLISNAIQVFKGYSGNNEDGDINENLYGDDNYTNI